MNANELAEQIEKHAQLLDNLTDFPKGVCDIKEAATILRQLQAENEALKAHPVELTDEEIFSIAIDCTYGGDLHADKFARAILRKAQEK